MRSYLIEKGNHCIDDTVVEERCKDRLYYLDCLRIMMAYGVVLLHSQKTFGTALPDSWNWNVMNGYNCIVRCCVPVFVMISGALFLVPSRKIDIKKLYTKNILHLVIAFLFWSCFYAGLYTFRFHLGKEYFLSTFITGYAHLWFIPMMICLYIVSPILRKITESKGLLLYFLALGVIFTFIIPEFLRILHSSVVNRAYENFNFYLTLGYVPYFMAGAYFAQPEISGNIRKAVYGIGIAGFSHNVFPCRVPPLAEFFSAVPTLAFWREVLPFLFSLNHVLPTGKQMDVPGDGYCRSRRIPSEFT